MTRSRARAGFVLLAWNRPELEARCVASIQAQQDPNWQLVVVDNGSLPPLRLARELVDDSRVSVIRNETNLGYAQGMNLGIRSVTADFIIPVNGDIVLQADFISRLSEKRDWCLRERVGSLAPQVLRGVPEAPEGIDSKGMFLRRRFSLISDDGMADGTEVFSGSGACAPYLTECLQEVCGQEDVFDNSYFAYGEDIDLQFRLHYAGWRCVYVESLVAWHLRSAYAGGVRSAFDKPEWVQFHILGNRVRNMVKYLSIRDVAWLGPFIAITEVAQMAWSVLRKRPLFPAYCRSYRAVWADRARLLATRRKVLRARAMSTRKLMELVRGI